MGGTLTPEDTPGGGLTMVIALPVAETSAARAERVRRRRSDEDPRRGRRSPARARSADHARGARLRGRGRARWRGRRRARRADAPRHRAAGPRHAAPRRRAGHRGAPRLDVGPDHRRVRPHRVGRQSRGAGCRRRRLRDQAVPDRRAARAAAGAVTASPRREPTTRSSRSGMSRSTSQRSRSPARGHACTSRPPSGGCSSSSPATRALW